MFADKAVVLTGASSGLGRALATALAGTGANLALFSRHEDRLNQTADLCRDRGRAPIVVPGDVRNPEDCRRLIERAAAGFGRLDYLIANAGSGMWARFEDITDLSVFRRLMETNYLGAVHCTYYALPHLRQSRGQIVVVSSIQGRIGVPFHTGYAAAKHALHGFFDSLRLELNGTGVDILMVMPHWIQGTGLRQAALGPAGTPMGPAARKHGSGALPVDDLSRRVLTAMRERRRELVVPGTARALFWLNAIAPRLAESIVRNRVPE